ncbi:hypothetical protein [Christiangramia sp.]|uniref:hypothetical protein n=1 Tax=Christiangramia sp. TaxID=1931228 RepID=UPI0026201A2F|nr:hypothetical protein [Christiangramia sp.]
MKTRLLLFLLTVAAFSSCSVDPIEEDLKQNQITEFNSEVEDYGCAGPDNSKNITYSEAQAIESWDEVRKLYLSLLSAGVSKDGTFDPSIWGIINEFQNKGIGDYSTLYSLTGECSDSVVLTISVIADPLADPCTDFTAGEDNSTEITKSEAEALESWDEVRKLYLSLLDSGVPKDGTFDPSIWDIINAFNNSEDPLGDYTTTYTITNGECTDSLELTVTVVADFSDPVCELSAGPDNMKTMTISEASALESWDEVRKEYLSLLATGVPRDGTFDPSIWDIINAFNATDNPAGDYTTTYTITDGQCSDSVELTIRVIED